MTLQDRLDQLIIHLDDLGAIEDELIKYERDVVRGIGSVKPDVDGISYIRQTVLVTIKKTSSFFREQVDAVRKISTPAAEQLDEILAAYEDIEEKIDDELQESEGKGGMFVMPELIERIDGHVSDLGKCYEMMRQAMTLTNNSIAGAIDFLISENTRKTGRMPGRGKRKRIL